MSRRNVATSRMASLLGLEELIAKSQTVDITDEATGRLIRGNLMDQAEGIEYANVWEDLINGRVTSSFLRDVTNLQVLDVLCGQLDRHGGNMMYKVENGNITGVQGIDNDAAFGTNVDVASTLDAFRIWWRKKKSMQQSSVLISWRRGSGSIWRRNLIVS